MKKKYKLEIAGIETLPRKDQDCLKDYITWWNVSVEMLPEPVPHIIWKWHEDYIKQFLKGSQILALNLVLQMSVKELTHMLSITQDYLSTTRKPDRDFLKRAFIDRFPNMKAFDTIELFDAMDNHLAILDAALAEMVDDQ